MKRTIFRIILSALILLISACTIRITSDDTPSPSQKLEQKPALTSAPDLPPTHPTPINAPLYLTTMTHMESGFSDDREQIAFLNHVEQLRYGINLAKQHGGKLTIESELPFAIGCDKWGVNMMREVLDSGMGVGTHSDVGFKDVLSVEELAREFSRRKSAVDRLVGAENNRGTSGGGSATDWVLAATQAGFKYMDGIVGMHYLSMPMKNRPGPQWTDEYIRAEGFHEGAPVDLYERIYPILMKNAIDFKYDEDGTILVISGEIGRLDTFAEGGDQSACPHKECPLTTEDTDALVEMINEVNTNRDKSRIAKLTVYLPASNFVPANESGLIYFFSEMQSLQDQGILTWATQGEVNDAFMASTN